MSIHNAWEYCIGNDSELSYFIFKRIKRAFKHSTTQYDGVCFGVSGVEYKIPPLWKRLMAEGIDFLLLLAIKLAVTFAAVDTFGFL